MKLTKLALGILGTSVALASMTACNSGGGGGGGSTPAKQQTHSATDCPDLAGNYASPDGTKSMTITTSPVSGGMTYNLGDGSEPLTADGGSHQIQDASYVATCDSGKVTTVISQNGSVVLTLNHTQINTKGDLRVVATGTDPSDETWIKQ